MIPELCSSIEIIVIEGNKQKCDLGLHYDFVFILLFYFRLFEYLIMNYSFK